MAKSEEGRLFEVTYHMEGMHTDTSRQGRRRTRGLLLLKFNGKYQFQVREETRWRHRFGVGQPVVLALLCR